MSDVVWTFVYKFLCSSVFISFGCLPQSGIAGSYGNSIFNFLRHCQIFPQWLHHFVFPPAMYEGPSFPTSLLKHVMICLFETVFSLALLYYRVCQTWVQMLPAGVCRAHGVSASFRGKWHRMSILQPTGTYCRAQGTLLNVTWQPGCKGSLGENGYMYVYVWAPSLSTWNHHNIVNQLYPNTK